MKPLILIVDDCEDDRLLMEFMLEIFDYRSIAIPDGTNALQVTQHYQPALILLDICMPGVDGYEVAGYLKQNSQTAAIPVIAVTATDVTVNEQFLAAGFDDYLIKPFMIESLKQTIDRHLSNVIHYLSIPSCQAERA